MTVNCYPKIKLSLCAIAFVFLLAAKEAYTFHGAGHRGMQLEARLGPVVRASNIHRGSSALHSTGAGTGNSEGVKAKRGPAPKRRAAKSFGASSRRPAKKSGSFVKTRGRSSNGGAIEESEEDAIEKWRIFNIEVPIVEDLGKDCMDVQDSLLMAICRNLRCKDAAEKLAPSDVQIVRRSFDSRKRNNSPLKFVYTVDVTLNRKVLKPVIYQQDGKFERLDEATSDYGEVQSLEWNEAPIKDGISKRKPRVVIVGAGPAGLFCAYALCMKGIKPVIVERGQPVEIRGRDIGALFSRKILNPDSNLCYGEGGAGTWSDGKLTTRIGKNSADVRRVLQTLVDHGATPRILVDGKPHLGTDKLVRILQDMRAKLKEMGAEFKFGCRVEDVVVVNPKDDGSNNRVVGVDLAGGERIPADTVVLAVGHSARSLYQRLIDRGVVIETKPIAVGFRIEHPQDLINEIQYGEFGGLCERGKGKIPVADYKLAVEVDIGDNAEEGSTRSCYSFCMCPGGQIVPTSVDPDELCINGMSFSNRQSKWANSALVVNVTPEDMRQLTGSDHPLCGVDWQKSIERKAALMGGGNLVAPVQTATDFLEGVSSAGKAIPQSSYRMGVKGAACHEIYPEFINDALRKALHTFDRRMPGFITPEALLHGVETRTSAPVQITRDPMTLECISMTGMYPAGEGAGYAGGIVSAAVDGLKVANQIIECASN